ncbi:MAG TPA: GntR family transcriptional regulator, partial [Hyphomicrobiaceae bacterium]|nr:GntR family transcriptional regulator [Hyphomicrobiaceae bacterium]
NTPARRLGRSKHICFEATTIQVAVFAMNPRLTQKALYAQVRDDIARRIVEGEWKPGTSLASEVDLARELQVSSGTVRKALDLLESERLVTRRQGRGTFVNDLASQEQTIRFSHFYTGAGTRIGGVIELRELDLVENGGSKERERLQLHGDEPFYRIQRVRSHAGKAFMVEQAAMPGALFPGLAEKEIPSFCAVVIANAYGVLLGKSAERLSVSAPSAAAADILGLARADFVFVCDRVIMTREGRPAEWRRAECVLPDGMHYVVDMQ